MRCEAVMDGDAIALRLDQNAGPVTRRINELLDPVAGRPAAARDVIERTGRQADDGAVLSSARQLYRAQQAVHFAQASSADDPECAAKRGMHTPERVDERLWRDDTVGCRGDIEQSPVEIEKQSPVTFDFRCSQHVHILMWSASMRPPQHGDAEHC